MCLSRVGTSAHPTNSSVFGSGNAAQRDLPKPYPSCGSGPRVLPGGGDNFTARPLFADA